MWGSFRNELMCDVHLEVYVHMICGQEKQMHAASQLALQYPNYLRVWPSFDTQ